jgi:hypothetical protein
MIRRRQTNCIQEGQYAAEVEVDLLETEEGWSPYLSLADVEKLDEVRIALRQGDLHRVGQLARLFKLTPITVWVHDPHPQEEAMTIHDLTIAKIQQLPEPLAQEVSDFIDFLLVKQDPMQWERWICFKEALDLAELSLSDYLPNLEAYKDRLARGEIRW